MRIRAFVQPEPASHGCKNVNDDFSVSGNSYYGHAVATTALLVACTKLGFGKLRCFSMPINDCDSNCPIEMDIDGQASHVGFFYEFFSWRQNHLPVKSGQDIEFMHFFILGGCFSAERRHLSFQMLSEIFTLVCGGQTQKLILPIKSYIYGCGTKGAFMTTGSLDLNFQGVT